MSEVPSYDKGAKVGLGMSRYLFGPSIPHTQRSECNQRPLTNIRITGLRHGCGGHRVTPKNSSYLPSLNVMPLTPQTFVQWVGSTQGQISRYGEYPETPPEVW